MALALIESFQDDEDGYQSWLRSHRSNGYVFNHFRGRVSRFNVLHAAGCRSLWRPKDEGRRTVVEKLCSMNLTELEAKIDELRGPDGWKRCGSCW